MGFFNALLKGLGFEGENKPKSVEKEHNEVVNVNTIAKYDLKNMETTKKEIKTFVPKNQQEIQDVVNVLKTGEVVNVNLENFVVSEYTRALDFMCGAIYVLNGKIKKNGDKTYLFYPNMDN